MHRQAWAWLVRAFRGMERGASYVEYAFLVSLIAVVCLVSIQFFGGSVSERFSRTGSTVGEVE